jgi:hypothetical protein
MSNTRPTGILATSIGTVHFTMTQANHVFLRTDSGNDEVVTIRGIPYHVSYHCHLIDGTWKAQTWNDLYLSRKDHSNKDASRPACKTAEAVLTAAWTSYLADHPRLSLAAERANAQEQIDSLENEVADLNGKLAAKRDEVSAAYTRLLELDEQ